MTYPRLTLHYTPGKILNDGKVQERMIKGEEGIIEGGGGREKPEWRMKRGETGTGSSFILTYLSSFSLILTVSSILPSPSSPPRLTDPSHPVPLCPYLPTSLPRLPYPRHLSVPVTLPSSHTVPSWEEVKY